MTFTFPNPQTTSQFTGDNGITYAWDVDDKKWQVKSFGSTKAGKTFNKDLVPQLRGTFEIDADGNAIAPDNAFFVDDKENLDGWENEIRYPGVWWKGHKSYAPKTITHLLISDSRYVEGVTDEGEYIWNELAFAPKFFPTDIIRVTASEHEAWHWDAGSWFEDNEYEGRRSDDVWRVTKVLDVTHPTMSTRSFQAYEVERVMPEDKYSYNWYVNDDEVEDDYFDKSFNPVWVTDHYLEKETPQFLQYKKRIPYSQWTRAQWQLGDSRGYSIVSPKDAVSLKLAYTEHSGASVDSETWKVGDTISFYSDDGQTEVASFHATEVKDDSDNYGKFLKITLDKSKAAGDDDLDTKIYYNIPNPAYKSEGPLDCVSKEYVDAADQHLQIQIDELEQEIDVIAPRLDGAQYKYVATPAVKPGEMHIASGSFTSGTDLVLFNDQALDGVTHGWGDLHVHDYLEITDTQQQLKTADNYAMYLVTKAPEGTGLKQIEVALVKGSGAPTVDDVLDAKGFQLAGGEINDLDSRYMRKDAYNLQLYKQEYVNNYNTKDWKTYSPAAGTFEDAVNGSASWETNQALIFRDLYSIFPTKDWEFVPGFVTGLEVNNWSGFDYVSRWQMRMDLCPRFDANAQVLRGYWKGSSPRNPAGKMYLRFECFRRK